MRTEQIKITYRLTFEAPFHCGTGLREGLVDRVVARDAKGFLYVPGSTVKGALRDRCEQLAERFELATSSPHTPSLSELGPDVDIIGRIFGTRFYPGRLYFDDAAMLEEDRQLFRAGKDEAPSSTYQQWQTETRTQVSLSRATRTARPGMLFTSEYGIPDLRFAGEIVGLLEGTELLMSADVGTFPLILLLSSLLSLESIGGSKSTGAGKVLCELPEGGLEIDGVAVPAEDLLDDIAFLESYEELREGAQ